DARMDVASLVVVEDAHEATFLRRPSSPIRDSRERRTLESEQGCKCRVEGRLWSRVASMVYPRRWRERAPPGPRAGRSPPLIVECVGGHLLSGAGHAARRREKETSCQPFRPDPTSTTSATRPGTCCAPPAPVMPPRPDASRRCPIG